MAMKVTLTEHARQDRLDRLSTILATVELGEIILKTPSETDKTAEMLLTSTGIIIVKSFTTGKIITGFMASPRKVKNMYKAAGFEKMPRQVKNTINKNMEKYSFLYKI